MNRSNRIRSFGLATAFAACAILAGCAGLEELGQEKKIPLTGDRKALFPQGIPGVEFGAPPTQPSNSNIAIQPNMGSDPDASAKQMQEAEAQKQKMTPAQARAAKAQQEAAGRAQRAAEARATKEQQAASRTAARKKSADSEDPWNETR
jgi:hypothetical protein